MLPATNGQRRDEWRLPAGLTFLSEGIDSDEVTRVICQKRIAADRGLP